jgi:PAS domain S-box-containing protein
MNPSVTTGHAQTSSRMLLRWLIGIDATIIGITVLLATLWMISNLNAVKEREQLVIENMANSLSNGIEAHLLHVDLGLKNILLEVSANPDIRSDNPKSINQILEEQRGLNPHIESLRIADASGMVRHGSGVNTNTMVDVSEREFFSTLKSRNTLDAQVTGPHMARISKKWVVTLSRRINRPDGSFAGVIYANLAADEFQKLFRVVKLGADDVISLRMDTRRLVTRFSPKQDTADDIGSVNISSELATALQEDPLAGTYTAPTPPDHLERINAYRKVDGFPMTVLVGVNTASYIQPWTRTAVHVVVLCVLIATLTVVASVLAYSSRKRVIFNEQKVRDQAERTAAILQTALDGIHLLDDKGLLLQANPAFSKMLGYREGFLIGQPLSYWSNLSLDDLRCLAQADDESSLVKVQTMLRRQAGDLLEVEIQARHVLLGDAFVWCCSARDMTHRKQQEAELRWNQTLLHSIAASSPLAILVTDYCQDKILFANPRFYQLWDLTHLEPGAGQEQLNIGCIIAACATRLLKSPDFVISFLKPVEGDTQISQELELDMADGRILRSIRVSMNDAQCQIFGNLFIFEDVTMRVSMTRNAQRAQSLLRGAIDALEEAFVLYDPSDRLLLFNDRYQALYVESADLMVPGALFEDIVREGALRGQYAEAVGRVDEWVAERMAKHRYPDGPMIQTLKDGRLVRVLERRLPDGHTVGFRMDVTQLFQAQGLSASSHALKARIDDDQLKEHAI